MCLCPLILGKDVMVKCHWCASTDNAMSDWTMSVVTSPADIAGVAIEAHCMGCGVPSPSPLLKDLEEFFAIWACHLFCVVHSRCLKRSVSKQGHILPRLHS